MKKDLFLVDADNTLLDFEASSMISLKESLEEFGVQWKEVYAEEFTRFNDSLWEQLQRHEITREQLISTRFVRLLPMLGLGEVDAVKFNERFLSTLSLRPVYMKGAESFLKELKKRGKVYIVTNGTAVIQRSRFSICGLNAYADDVFISDTIGVDKPHEGYTKYVLSHIENFQKERAIWIGDSLSADIKASTDAGIDCIWFNPKNQPLKGDVAPTFIAQNFEEVGKILGF